MNSKTSNLIITILSSFIKQLYFLSPLFFVLFHFSHFFFPQPFIFFFFPLSTPFLLPKMWVGRIQLQPVPTWQKWIQIPPISQGNPTAYDRTTGKMPSPSLHFSSSRRPRLWSFSAHSLLTKLRRRSPTTPSIESTTTANPSASPSTTISPSLQTKP